MATLELNREEAELLRTYLQRDISDLRMEIADTDKKDFRDDLKHRKEVLMQIIERLPQ